MDSRPRLHGGRLCAGTTGGDVGMRGEGRFQICPCGRRTGGSLHFHANDMLGVIGTTFEGRAISQKGRAQGPPLRRGRMDGGRMALRAGLGDGFPPSSSRGQALRGNNRWGVGGQDLGMDSRLRLHGGRLCAGMTGWARGWEVGEGDGSPHTRGQRMGKGWIAAPVFTGEGSTREHMGGDVGMRGEGRFETWHCGRGRGGSLYFHANDMLGAIGTTFEGRVISQKGRAQGPPLRRAAGRLSLGRRDSSRSLGMACGSVLGWWGRDGRFANRPYEERRDIEHGRWVLRAGLGDGFPPSSSRGQALRGNNGWG